MERLSPLGTLTIEQRRLATGVACCPQYRTIVWKSECLVAVVAGFLAGSVAIVGFGSDSAIEVTSGFAPLCACGGMATRPGARSPSASGVSLSLRDPGRRPGPQRLARLEVG